MPAVWGWAGMGGLILLYLVGYLFFVLPVTYIVGRYSKMGSELRRYGLPFILTTAPLFLVGGMVGDQFIDSHYSSVIFFRHMPFFFLFWFVSFAAILYSLQARRRRILIQFVVSSSTYFATIRSKMRKGVAAKRIRLWMLIWMLIEYSPVALLLFAHYHTGYVMIDIGLTDFNDQKASIEEATVVAKKVRSGGARHSRGSRYIIFLNRPLFDGYSHIKGQHFFERCYIGYTFRYKVYRSFFGNPVMMDEKCIGQ
ncbi:MAG: hypothetical protein CVV45_06340 [Spirochaetae bacterium HGW-Spirochaetae-10]|nr:MAG: hypothetical protein CVV45_06340 [Spirochaetae bacterium HGW-Spirochaetae-10]